jgi:hypothetical protein
MALAAEKLTRWYHGKPAYRVPVVVKFNDSRLCATVAELRTSVIALSVEDAANFVRDEFGSRAETEITAYGPKGGKCHRYIGWESSIWHEMIRSRPTVRQPALPFVEAA